MNLTNLIPAITVLLLVTNESIRWPVTMEPAPCPDGMIGCLVMHYKEVPVPNPTNRWRVTKVHRIERTEIPSLSLTNVTKDELISETETDEFAELTWRTGATRTNEVWRGMALANFTGTNYISTNGLALIWNTTSTNVFETPTVIPIVTLPDWTPVFDLFDKFDQVFDAMSNNLVRIIKDMEKLEAK